MFIIQLKSTVASMSEVVPNAGSSGHLMTPMVPRSNLGLLHGHDDMRTLNHWCSYCCHYRQMLMGDFKGCMNESCIDNFTLFPSQFFTGWSQFSCLSLKN